MNVNMLPVTIVEQEFFNESKHDKLKNDPVKRRQFTAEAAAAPFHHDERQIHERNANDCLVKDHHHNGLTKLSNIHL